MGRSFLALAMIVVAFLRGDLLHPSPLYSLWLPLLGVAAFVYLMSRLLARRGRNGYGNADSGATGGDCGWDSGDCGGGDGGGD